MTKKYILYVKRSCTVKNTWERDSTYLQFDLKTFLSFLMREREGKKSVFFNEDFIKHFCVLGQFIKSKLNFQICGNSEFWWCHSCDSCPSSPKSRCLVLVLERFFCLGDMLTEGKWCSASAASPPASTASISSWDKDLLQLTHSCDCPEVLRHPPWSTRS